MPRLLFIYLKPTSFVRDDLALLAERYDVRAFHFDADRARSAPGLAALWARQLHWLVRELPRADVVYGWFADYHMVLPVLLGRLYGRPVAVALGGNDCMRLPELGYGVFESRWRAPLARFVHHNASLVLPVTGALIETEDRFSTWPEPRANGVRAHVPDFDTPVRVAPTGYDPEAWPAGPAERPPVVCTVGLFDSDRTLRRKGVDLLIEAARRLPEVTVQVIGVPDALSEATRARYRPPANVQLLPPRPREALVAAYHGASVYAQLSRAEGLPNVLCEAMLCGCIPVGSAVFGIPEGMGGVGEVVESPEPDVIADAIRRAMHAGARARRDARAHVADRFHRDRRRDTLFGALSDLRRGAVEGA